MGCKIGPLAKPSMVVIWAPLAWTANMEHDLTASPFMRMVQQPHWLVSQPTCVPVSFKLSRKTSASKARSSTSTLWTCPLIFSDILLMVFNSVVRLSERRLGHTKYGPGESDMLLGHECHPERYREQTSSLLAQCLQRLLPLAIGKHSLLRL